MLSPPMPNASAPNDLESGRIPLVAQRIEMRNADRVLPPSFPRNNRSFRVVAILRCTDRTCDIPAGCRVSFLVSHELGAFSAVH
jgi:hypothetical protein